MNPLQPIGVGTVGGESLSSYVQRLAADHGTYPGQLVFRVFVWLDRGRPESVGRWAPHPGRVRIGFNNNSGNHADVWLRVLQRFTWRADLLPLTTRTWDGCFPSRGLQTGSLRWCPDCLEQDQIPYHRLSWMLQPVSVCAVHGRRLRQACRRCERVVPVLHDRSGVLHCPWCRGDLRTGSGKAERVRPDDFDWWCSEEVGRLVAAAPRCFHDLSWAPNRALRSVAARRGIGTAAAFARFVGRSRLTGWYWWTGRARPTLPATLQVYHRFGIRLSDHLLAPDQEDPLTADEGESQLAGYLSSKRRARTIDWGTVRCRLTRVLEVPLARAPTLLEVSVRLGIARRNLRDHAPELCRKISERHRERVAKERADRDEQLANRIRSAIGFNPTAGRWVLSPRKIARSLGRPSLFNSRYARNVLSKCLRAKA